MCVKFVLPPGQLADWDVVSVPVLLSCGVSTFQPFVGVLTITTRSQQFAEPLNKLLTKESLLKVKKDRDVMITCMRTTISPQPT